MSFSIGDRVVYNSFGVASDSLYGKRGTIVAIGNTGGRTWYGVSFDERVGAHNLDGKCEQGHGWWSSADALNLLDETDYSAISPLSELL